MTCLAIINVVLRFKYNVRLLALSTFIDVSIIHIVMSLDDKTFKNSKKKKTQLK